MQINRKYTCHHPLPHEYYIHKHIYRHGRISRTCLCKIFSINSYHKNQQNRRTPPRRDWAYILFPHKVKVLLQLIYVKPQFLGKCGQISVQWNIKKIFCFAVLVCDAVLVRGEPLLSAMLRYIQVHRSSVLCALCLLLNCTGTIHGAIAARKNYLVK